MKLKDRLSCGDLRSGDRFGEVECLGVSGSSGSREERRSQPNRSDDAQMQTG
jgi:hypothetical protein